MSVPNINDIISEDCITEDDIDPTQIEEILLPAHSHCVNVVDEFLWNTHYHNKLLDALYSHEQECYVFYSLNSFTHTKINFVCSRCVDVAKFVWFNALPNAFVKRHHCHMRFIIFCDKCKQLCNNQPNGDCIYFGLDNNIESENVSANNYVAIPYLK